MRYSSKVYKNFNTRVEFSNFEVNDQMVTEQMCMIHSVLPSSFFEIQLNSIVDSYRWVKDNEVSGRPIFIRIFISDSANQEALVRDAFKSEIVPISIIEQPPLDGSKIAMWVYFQSNIESFSLENGLYHLKHGAYTHLWSAGASDDKSVSSNEQTINILSEYSDNIKKEEATLLDHTIRTWFFVQNVDVNYAGVVKGRNFVFDKEGLVPTTNFITSTGIQGRVSDYNKTTVMDAYTIKGVKKEQIQFLYAPTHLNSTYEYGVRFERGTAVHYGDRSHVFLSGTASIDNRGDVLHVGNIEKQTYRMLENVEVLLAEAGAGFSDLAQVIVYLRDIFDYKLVNDIFNEKLPDVPKVIVLAPVCRPTWLIEMECIALKEGRSEYANY